MHGIPDVLYVDHGSDFTSDHIEQVAAALRIELIHSTVGRPQGRGKVERFFGTINTELLPGLAGHLVEGSPQARPPCRSRNWTLRSWRSSSAPTISARTAKSTKRRMRRGLPKDGAAHARQPRRSRPLLLTVAKARTVQRDGIHFQGLRYIDTTLAAYVGEAVTIRYDPRDLSEIRVFHQIRFLCRAVSPEHAGRP